MPISLARRWCRKTIIATLLVCTHHVSICQVYHSVQGLSSQELDASVWILGGRSDIEGKTAKVEFDGRIYRETVDDVTDFFTSRNDSVFWTGYNVGRRIGFVADNPILMDAGRSDYSATGKLDGAFPLTESGYFEIQQPRLGNALVSASDTIKNVRLLKTIQTRIFPETDSIPADTVIIETLRWHLPNAALPFAIQRDGVLYVASDANNENDNIDNGNDTDAAEHVKAIISSASVEVNDSQVNVRLPEPLPVSVYVMDRIGNIYASVTGEDSVFTLDVSGLPHNVYIIDIVSQEFPEVSYKLIKQL